MERTGLSAQIADYILRRSGPKLEKFDNGAAKQLGSVTDDTALATLKGTLAQKRAAIVQQFTPVRWLSDAASRAKQIQMVTHALKFTHCDAKGSSFYSPGAAPHSKSSLHPDLISTASLSSPRIDVVGNAAALDVAGLLQLKDENRSLIECIDQGDYSPLEAFAESESQLKEWVKGFRAVLDTPEPSSHTLTKQLYFPIEGDQYHLLAPIYASSLADALYQEIATTRYSDQSKAARKAKRESRYHETVAVDYPNTAQQTFGGTKPQNISQLNSKRGGRSILLSCAPPAWQSRVKPPLFTKTIFSINFYGWRVRQESNALRAYLRGQVNKTSTKPVRDERAERIDALIDHLIQYAAEIQNLKHHTGWSASPDCKLSVDEQLWLDPRRASQDEAFALEREKGDWQEMIAAQFASWLNARIKGKWLTPGDVEHREWKSLLAKKLRLLRDDLEAFS